MRSKRIASFPALGIGLSILSVAALLISSAAAPAVCGQARSEAEIRALLQKWRDQIKPGLPAQEVKTVENQAGAVPVDVPADRIGLTFDDSESKAGHRVEVTAGRRDMVYALAGYGYTLVGGSYPGQKKMKDMGLWCFLEAALIRMTSAHLLDVAFHLNERKAYDDAVSLLGYALTLDPYSAPAHNNLAYSLAAKGQLKDAVSEAARALSLAPERESYLARLKYFGKQAGIKVDDLAAAARSQGAGQGTPSQACQELVSLIGPKITAYNLEHFGYQFQGLHQKCFSGQPGSFDAILGDRLMAIDREAERCASQNCFPDGPGVLIAGLQECLCQCGLIAVRQAYAAHVEFYRQCDGALRPWLERAAKANDLLNVQLGEQIEARRKALKPGELALLNRLLDTHYFAIQDQINGGYDDLEGAYRGVADAWQTIQDRIRECRSKGRGDQLGSPEDLFGKRPPRLRRVIRESDKPWAFWFFFGELRLGPGDNMNLSLGRPGLASAKIRFNFETYDFGAGVGLGLNPCRVLGPGAGGFNQLFKLELIFMADTEKGITYDLDGRVRTMKTGAISMADQPMVTLEN